MRKRVRIVRILFLMTLAVMLLLASNVFLVSIRKVHLRSGTDLSAYADSANTVHETLKATRGNIYDRNGTVIAQDRQTYNIVCILSPDRPTVNNKIVYVQDVEGTARALSKILDADYDTLFGYLNQYNTNGLWQTELGPAGRNLSKATMEKIQDLGLPGIEFTDSIQRVYPLGSFASNLIGFAQSDENGTTVGKMGTELYLDSYLSGIDGSRTYQADSNGYILPGMKEEIVSAVNGYDVYLTIDQELQEALEDAFEKTTERFDPLRIWGSVMDLDTGKILAWGQSPSFDPNLMDIADYNNYGTQLPYEPGSTLKSFTWAAAVDYGVYDGDALVYGGPYCYISDENNNPLRVQESRSCIYNAGRVNYGMTTYDHGMIYSANTIALEIQNSLITPQIHLDYLKKFGFFQPVNSDGLPEESGILNFTYAADRASLSYGQGSTVTMLQLMQAYSALFTDGTMKKPYYVESIRDPYDSSHVIYQAETRITGQPITEESAKEMQKIMWKVVNDDEGTARWYRIPDCELMGKTGTTQVAINGSYASGYTIVSLMCALPADDPQVMVYYAFEAAYNPSAHYYSQAQQDLLRTVALKIGVTQPEAEQPSEEPVEETEEPVITEIVTNEMPNVINHSLAYAHEKLDWLNTDLIVLGAGDTVIDQYPKSTAMVATGQKVFLLTDTNSFIMPDMTGWTRKDVTALWSVTEFGVRMSGEGRVTSQSIPPGTMVTRGTDIEVIFE